MMNLILTCLWIFAARALEVALSTLRAMAVNQGRRGVAVIYAFFQTLIWIFVVSEVLKNLDSPTYLISFSLGFAFGTYLGMVIETWLGHGHRVVRVFTKIGKEVAEAVRENGFPCTVFHGEGRDGDIQLLFIQVRRKRRKEVLSIAQEVDPNCFYSFDAANVVPKVG